MLTAIGTGMASNAGGLLGAAVHQDARSVTQSAIGANVVVTAGSVSGTLSHDPSSANHPLTNSFDAQKMQNDLQIQQVGSQVVGEVGGLVVDTLHNAGVSGFDETNWKDNYGRALLEAAGSAGVAALGHENVAASGVGTAIAGETIAAAAPEVAKWAVQQSSDPNTQRILVSAVMNSLADAVSAAGGSALSGGQSAVEPLLQNLMEISRKKTDRRITRKT
jgi:filamentous hemagglutinin